MADLSDVLDTLCEGVQTAVYPNGTSQPSVTGGQIIIVPGWPIRNQLDDTMKSGACFVSVFPTARERVTTKFPRDWQTVSIAAPTLTATIVDNTITIGGTVTVPQAVMVISNDVGYAHQALITDTLDDIAAALAALIPGASATGSLITIADSYRLITRITVQAQVAQRLGMQRRDFMITCWCPTPDLRKTLAPYIDIYFRQNFQIALSDGFYCHIWYSGTHEIDEIELVNIYRRDLIFSVQYETTFTQSMPIITDSFGISAAVPIIN